MHCFQLWLHVSVLTLLLHMAAKVELPRAPCPIAVPVRSQGPDEAAVDWPPGLSCSRGAGRTIHELSVPLQSGYLK
jgi:hypothetical protein